MGGVGSPRASAACRSLVMTSKSSLLLGDGTGVGAAAAAEAVAIARLRVGPAELVRRGMATRSRLRLRGDAGALRRNAAGCALWTLERSAALARASAEAARAVPPCADAYAAASASAAMAASDAAAICSGSEAR